MDCLKVFVKTLKNIEFGLLSFLGLKTKTKKLGFLKPISTALSLTQFT